MNPSWPLSSLGGMVVAIGLVPCGLGMCCSSSCYLRFLTGISLAFPTCGVRGCLLILAAHCFFRSNAAISRHLHSDPLFNPGTADSCAYSVGNWKARKDSILGYSKNKREQWGQQHYRLSYSMLLALSTRQWDDRYLLRYASQPRLL